MKMKKIIAAVSAAAMVIGCMPQVTAEEQHGLPLTGSAALADVDVGSGGGVSIVPEDFKPFTFNMSELERNVAYVLNPWDDELELKEVNIPEKTKDISICFNVDRCDTVFTAWARVYANDWGTVVYEREDYERIGGVPEFVINHSGSYEMIVPLGLFMDNPSEDGTEFEYLQSIMLLGISIEGDTENSVAAITITDVKAYENSHTVEECSYKGVEDLYKPVSGEIDGFCYEENKDGGLTITGYTGEGGDIVIPAEIEGKKVTGIGEEAFYGCTSLTSAEIPNSVTVISRCAFTHCTSLASVEIPNGVTEMGSSAFSGCASLTSVEIPNSVTEIGWYAFSDCTSLTSVEIPNSVTVIGYYAFENCTSLVSGEIPNSVVMIGDSAFSGCTSLISVDIPNSVTGIGGGAFSGCTALTSINVDEKNENYSSENGILFNKDKTTLIQYPAGKTDKSYYIPDSVEEIGDGAFSCCTSLTSVEIANSVTVIGGSAFRGCTSLASVEITNGVTGIFSYTFYGCTSLVSVEIPNGVTEIGRYAFFDCTSLTTVEIPNSVTEIGDSAFEGCTSLTTVEIPNSVTEIGWYAFSDCASLTSVIIPNSVTVIQYRTFSGCTSLASVEIPNSVTAIEESVFDKCTSLTTVEIPSSVTVIGDNIFRDCTSLTSVKIPNSVTVIGDGTFYGCASLTSVKIPNSVTVIGDNIFRDCTSLALVEIPNSVTVIGEGAFLRCTSLTTVEIPNSVTEIGDGAFEGCTSLTSVEIPNSVIVIGDWTFSECTSLTSVKIPNSVTKIGDYTFSYCNSLTKINVDEKNGNYSSADGVLFNKDKTTLIQYPAGKTDKNYSILDSVTAIGCSAFSRCRYLTSVEIPNSVTEIGDYAFSGCTSFTIYGSESSYAQSYAKQNEIRFKIIGKEVAIDHDNGIIIENPNLEGKTFEVEKVEDSTEEKIIFNITLKDENGKEIQPEGNVKVKIPLPVGWDSEKTTVSRRETDGTLTDMKATCENGYLVFITDHFSEYILAIKPDVKIADLNSDGKITTVDAKWVLQAVSGSRELTEEQKAAADVNGDGKITTVDAKWILQAVSGSRDF